MDSLVASIDPQIVLIVSAIAVSLLLLRLLFQVFQVGFGSMVAILVVLLVLYYFFDISPKQVWFEMSHLPRDLVQWARSLT